MYNARDSKRVIRFCSENEYHIGQYPAEYALESSKIYACKVLMAYSAQRQRGGMIHIYNKDGYPLLKTCMSELELSLDSLNFTVATKTFKVDLKNDPHIATIVKFLNTSFDELLLNIIAMDCKSSVMLHLKSGIITTT